MTGTLGVIFDMDGVLIDSAEAHFQAWCLLAKEVGKAHPREFFEKTFGMHNREILPLWLGDGLPREEIERLSVRKEALFRKIAATTAKPLPGAVDLIEALAGDGFLLAVGSSGLRENVDLVLGILNVRQHFAAWSTGDDVAIGKPHPEVFLKAAERLRIAPTSCAVIEDSPQGIEAALAAGAKAVAVTSTRCPEELQAAHLVVRSLEDLDPDRLARLILGSG